MNANGIYYKINFLLIILSGIISCTSPKQKLSPELQKIVDHYSHSAADTLKLKAAFFLIENMRDRHATTQKN